jgi:hypothetical protein
MSNPRRARGSGRRNIDCGDYGTCLELAAKSNWPRWNCGRCERKDKKNVEPDGCTARYWRLLRTAFAPGPAKPKARTRKRVALTCAEIEALIDLVHGDHSSESEDT